MFNEYIYTFSLLIFIYKNYHFSLAKNCFSSYPRFSFVRCVFSDTANNNRQRCLSSMHGHSRPDRQKYLLKLAERATAALSDNANSSRGIRGGTKKAHKQHGRGSNTTIVAMVQLPKPVTIIAIQSQSTAPERQYL